MNAIKYFFKTYIVNNKKTQNINGYKKTNNKVTIVITNNTKNYI